MDRPAPIARIAITPIVRIASIATACLLALASHARSQELAPTQWATDGVVYGSEVSGSTLYLGGTFTLVGRRAGPGAVLDPVSGALSSATPLFRSNTAATPVVHAVIADGAGGWYVGGLFDVVAGVARRNLVHLNSSLQPTSWDPSPDGAVRAIVASGSVIYLGGNFLNVGGQARNRIAAVDAATGLASSWDPDADNTVYALAVAGSAVYAGGAFTAIGGESRFHAGALNVADGLATAWDPNATGGFWVRALAIGGTTVYVGGDFTSLGGELRNHIGAVDMAAGDATNWDPDPDLDVRVLRVLGSSVYVGGQFTNIGGQDRNRLAEIRINNGAATSWDPDMDALVSSLDISGSTMLAGGMFEHAGGEARLHLAAIDLASGNPTSWDPRVGFPQGGSTDVSAVAVSGAQVFAGGFFSAANIIARTNLAAIDRLANAVTAWAPSPDAAVRGIAVAPGTVYARGDFTNIGGQVRNNLAALDAATGAATAWAPNPNGGVGAIELANETLYVGGTFTQIASTGRNRVAAFDVSTGTLTAWNPDASSSVGAIAVDGSTVYLGGFFEQIGGQPRGQIAAVDAVSGAPSSWDPAGPSGNGTLFPIVLCIEVAGGRVYAGGVFTGIGGQSATNVAALDPVTAVADAWAPGGTGGANFSSSNRVYDLLVRGDDVVIGGQFPVMGGQSRLNLALVDATTGLANDWAPAPTTAILGLVDTDGGFFATGAFSKIEGTHAGHVAEFVDAPVVGVPGPPPARAASIALSSVAPHPLGARGFVHFELARPGHVTLDLVDAAGRLVRTVVHATRFEAGPHAVPIDRAGLAPGFYLLRLRQGNDTATRKLIVPF